MALTVGDVIADRYTIKSLIGRGGMGIVYEVIDEETSQRLALKTIIPEYLADKQVLRRFVREVNAVRKLDHPCVVKIFDARHIDNLLFYTMEYVEGETLRDMMIKRGRFGLGSTVRVLSLLCYALEHAHKVTIHRDLSPENVMVTKAGNIKLLDFGLAKLNDADGALTRVGVSLGKLHYGAPEQRADAKNVDHRADLFSLGVMFFEMLAGELPEIARAPITAMVPGLPSECDAFVNKATAKNREDRFGSARELRMALAEIYRIYRQSASDRAKRESAKTVKKKTKPPRTLPEKLLPLPELRSEMKPLTPLSRTAQVELPIEDMPVTRISRFARLRASFQGFFARLLRRN